jgi:hypothetical protein
MKLIHMSREVLLTKWQREVVELAFEYWLERFGVLEGTPGDDFHRPQRDVMARISKSQNGSVGLFLVPRVIRK